MNTLFFLLGSNLGNRESNLAFAREALADRIGKISQLSSIYETAAWGNENQPHFLNQVVVLESTLSAIDTLAHALQIEADLGRIREKQWDSRILDVDILYYGDAVMRMSDLVIPHPRIEERRFTLIPLCEVAPDFIHPKLQKSNSTLLQECLDTLEVRKL